MNWLQDLLTNPDSIAHIVALYAFVIAAGVLLGKSKYSASPWALPSSFLWESLPDTSDLQEISPFFPSCRISD